MKRLLLLGLFLLLSSKFIIAQIIHVPGDQPTIKAGIDAAVDGDTVLVADGTYTGEGSGLYGKNIVVKSQNGPLNCIIDGQGTAYIGFGDGYSYEGLNTVIEGFTVRNFSGRGFDFYAGTCPTIRDNIIESCGDGGIAFSGGSPVIENNVIQNNEGPGIKSSSSTAQIIANTIRGNRANNGAGISLSGSAATIMNNIIYENSSEKGGGLYCSNSSSATIINNTIIDNAAIFGGGVYLDESAIILTNNIIAFSKYKPALNQNMYAYNFETHVNYDGAKITSIDYTFVLHNQGNSGLVNFLSTSSFGGRNIDTTFQLLTEERKTISINSKVNEYGDFGGLRMVISLNNDTLSVNADGPSSFRPGSYFITFAMSADAVPASIEIVEIGQGSEITYCDIFGNQEGNYYSGASDSELEEIVLDGANGNFSEDPLCSHPGYILTAVSPCIDTGNPDASFNDCEIPPGMGTETCDIGAYGGFGNCFVTSINQTLSLPIQFKLNQNYPNPFNPSTTINYTIPERSNVVLNVFDVLGGEVSTLVNKEQPQGNYQIEFDGNELTSGIYFYRFQAGDFMETKKMILLK